MLAEKTLIPDLTECVDRATFRVTAPTQVILVCGGYDPVVLPARIASFRDAFLRAHLTSGLRRFSVRMAEDVVPFFPSGEYKDILNFESDIAQICELVILFAESPGSFAELGAFAMEPEIAARMLAVITRWFYDRQSFIRLGPIKALENAYGPSARCVLNDAQLNIPQSGSPVGLSLPHFRVAMEEAVNTRLKNTREPTSFNPLRNGHLIKLITGIIQHYGAVTLEEIEVTLFCLDIYCTRIQIVNFLLCAEFMEWIVKTPLGLETYYAARNLPAALVYRFTKTSGVKDERRLRLDIREYWKLRQPQRFDCIKSAMAI